MARVKGARLRAQNFGQQAIEGFGALTGEITSDRIWRNWLFY